MSWTTKPDPGHRWLDAFNRWMRARYGEHWTSEVTPDAIDTLKDGFRAGFRAGSRPGWP